MSSGRLAAWVHVPDEDGQTHAFGPDDVVPDWAAAKITNPKAWVDSDDVVAEGAAPVAPSAPAPSVNGVERPPAGGAGSDVGHWVTYAESLGIDVPEGATRGDVITLVEAFEDEQK